MLWTTEGLHSRDQGPLAAQAEPSLSIQTPPAFSAKLRWCLSVLILSPEFDCRENLNVTIRDVTGIHCHARIEKWQNPIEDGPQSAVPRRVSSLAAITAPERT